MDRREDPKTVPDTGSGPCILVSREINKLALQAWSDNPDGVEHFEKKFREDKGVDKREARMRALDNYMQGWLSQWAVSQWLGSEFQGIPSLQAGDGGFDTRFQGKRVEVKSTAWFPPLIKYRPHFIAKNPNMAKGATWDIGILCLFSARDSYHTRVLIHRCIPLKKFQEVGFPYRGPMNLKDRYCCRDRDMYPIPALWKQFPEPTPVKGLIEPRFSGPHYAGGINAQSLVP